MGKLKPKVFGEMPTKIKKNDHKTIIIGNPILENDETKLSLNEVVLIIQISELKKITTNNFWLICQRYKKLKDIFDNDGIKGFKNWDNYCLQKLKQGSTTIKKCIAFYKRFKYDDLNQLPDGDSKKLLIGSIDNDSKRNKIIDICAEKNPTFRQLEKLVKSEKDDKRLSSYEDVQKKKINPSMQKIDWKIFNKIISDFQEFGQYGTRSKKLLDDLARELAQINEGKRDKK